MKIKLAFNLNLVCLSLRRYAEGKWAWGIDLKVGTGATGVTGHCARQLSQKSTARVAFKLGTMGVELDAGRAGPFELLACNLNTLVCSSESTLRLRRRGWYRSCRQVPVPYTPGAPAASPHSRLSG